MTLKTLNSSRGGLKAGALKLKLGSESPGEFVKTDCWAPPPGFPGQ